MSSGGYDPTNPQYGAGTGPGNVSSSGMGTTETYSGGRGATTTGTHTAAMDPKLSSTGMHGIGSGVGIHAQQYRGRQAEYVPGTTTTVTSGGTTGLGHHLHGHHHHGHHTGGESTTAQTLGETENVYRAPGAAGAGAGMGTTYPQGTTTSTTAGRQMGQEQPVIEQSATQHGKPTMMDKIIGGTEKGLGKITSNPAMVEKGAERAAGEFERPSKT